MCLFFFLLCMRLFLFFFFFFFNDTATTEIYTLSLHDALPISNSPLSWQQRRATIAFAPRTVQNIPDRLRRAAITVLQPASITPEPTRGVGDETWDIACALDSAQNSPLRCEPSLRFRRSRT